MPRDVIPQDLASPSDAPAKPDLSKPSVEGLIYLLRHLDEEMPDFIWDYVHYLADPTGKDCKAGCAFAVLYHFWDKQLPRITQRRRNVHAYVQKALGLSQEVTRATFSGPYDGMIVDDVTPQRVADRLEWLTSGHPIQREWFNDLDTLLQHMANCRD
jgi:hypothetical protein